MFLGILVREDLNVNVIAGFSALSVRVTLTPRSMTTTSKPASQKWKSLSGSTCVLAGSGPPAEKLGAFISHFLESTPDPEKLGKVRVCSSFKVRLMGHSNRIPGEQKE